ncbi:MAG: FtsX-like permease family protein [Promethearchaeia archaeon]
MAAKNLTRVKSRTILTILAIALGTALLTGITILNESYLQSYLNGVAEQLGYTDIGIKEHLNVSDGYFEADDFIKESNADKIDGYISHTGRIVSEHIVINAPEQPQEYAYETTFFGIDVKNDVGYGKAEFLNWTDNVENSLKGEPENIEEVLKLNQKYVVITNWVQDVYDFQLGDTLYIPLRSDNTTNWDNSSTWESYTVAAIINDKAEGWDISYDYSVNKSTRIHITRAIYVDINEMRLMLNVTGNKINLLYIHVEFDKLVDYGNELLKKMPYSYYGENIKRGMMEQVADSVRSMQMILIIFTMISFIIAAMLTLNTLMMSVSEQKYEIGVLRAQGIYKSEIFKLFLFEAIILALIGAILGIFMGLGLSPLLKKVFFTSIMAESDFQLTLTYNWLSLLIVFTITFAVSVGIGLLPAYIATKIQIIEAIRNIKSSESGKKIKKLIFPLIGIILAGFGYCILATSYRNLTMTLIGIIPFILGLIVISTIFIPILSKFFSYIFALFLGVYRKVTDKNLKRDPKQTKITFIMFGLAIGFLVMVANVLYSLDKIYYNTMPRYLGGDIVLSSEGSTFGMDEVLIADKNIIDGAIEKAAVMNSMRVKIDGYGTWWSDKQDEPRVNVYIIEGEKFYNAVNEVKMQDTGGLSDKDVFKKLDSQRNSVIITKQLADEEHLDKSVGDNVTIDFGSLKVNATIIGITDFISGISETWEEKSDITPANKRGKYCAFISWQSVIPIINDYFDWLPEADLLLKGDDHDFDYWDLPWINRTLVRQKIMQFAKENGYEGKVQIAERVWDNETNTIVANSSYNSISEILNKSLGKAVHIAWENTSLKGYTELLYKLNNSYETVQDALNDGKDHCVITEDIMNNLSLNVGDKISCWYRNSSNQLVRKNFTIAAVLSFATTIEAVNFHAQNPYVSGNYDVAADDSTAIIVNINQTAPYGSKLMYEDYFNRTEVYEFWIKLTDYFNDHLKFISGLQEYMGNDYVIADMRWLFTREYSYAPDWIIQVNGDKYTQEEALERIKEFLLLNKMPVISWQSVDGLRKEYSDQINFQKSFFNIVLSFALIIAVLGIMINMLISIGNRKREIGMMRAIGTYKGSLIKMILGETMILVFSGFLIGALMGTFAANQLILGLPLDPVFNLQLYIDYLSILFLFGIVIIISVIAAFLPAYRILKLDIIEALRFI